MFQKLLNQARFGVVLRPRGPILVKSGVETPDPTRPGMEFVRTRHADLGEVVYLPGTSLKGAIRAHAERTLSGLGVEVCDPLDKQKSCHGKHRTLEVPSAQIFQRQCPVCRTFGSLHLAGRAHVLDAYPWPADGSPQEQQEALTLANAAETRWQVAIDRQSGQAHGGALFDLEVVVNGEFHAEIHLRNFQLWQLGLVAAVLREMDEGHVAVGFGKSRGLGQVSVRHDYLFFTSVDRSQEEMRGVSALGSTDEQAPYGLYATPDAVPLNELPNEGFSSRRTWRGSEIEARGQGLEALLDQIMDRALAGFVEVCRRQPAKKVGS